MRGVGTLYLNDEKIGIITDFNLNLKKGSEMSKSNKKSKAKKHYIKMLKDTIADNELDKKALVDEVERLIGMNEFNQDQFKNAGKTIENLRKYISELSDDLNRKQGQLNDCKEDLATAYSFVNSITRDIKIT